MADTAAYYHAAYVVAGALYLLYTVSLVRRRRQVLARLAALDDAADSPSHASSGASSPDAGR